MLCALDHLSNKRKYGFIGKMEDSFEKIPIQKRCVLHVNAQRDALLLMPTGLYDDLSIADAHKIKKEVRGRMPSGAYSQQAYRAQLAFLHLIPNCNWIHDGGVFLGAAVALVVVE